MSRASAEFWVEGSAKFLLDAAAALEELQRLKITVMTPVDPGYPGLFEEFDQDPPGLLYLYGNLKLLKGRTFSVLASRKAPPAARKLLEKCTEDGVLSGEILVSGHNTPEYKAAGVVPLRWGAPRVLVLDRELFDALGEDLSQEAFQEARLWRHQFDPSTDLALTTIHPTRHAHQGANRQRDRIIAALSRRLDFVYLMPGGNMEKLAQQAVRAGRKVRVGDTFPGALDWKRHDVELIPPI